jgi:hypothetical protein
MGRAGGSRIGHVVAGIAEGAAGAGSGVNVAVADDYSVEGCSHKKQD